MRCRNQNFGRCSAQWVLNNHQCSNQGAYRAWVNQLMPQRPTGMYETTESQPHFAQREVGLPRVPRQQRENTRMTCAPPLLTMCAHQRWEWNRDCLVADCFEKQSHFYGTNGSFIALVVNAWAAAINGLLFSVQGEHTKHHWNSS